MGTNSKTSVVFALFALFFLVVLTTRMFAEGVSKEKAEVVEDVEEYNWKPFVPDSSLDYPWDPGQCEREVGPNDQRNADFSGRSLLGHTFNKVDARGARFDGADLRHAVFAYYTKLNGASFRGADLRRARFIGCDGLTADNDLTDALINDTWSSRDQDLKGAFLLTEKQLRSTKSFKDQNLNGCSLVIEGAPTLDLRHFDLRNMVIQMDFSNCRMEGADLTGSVILRGSKISQEQIKSTSQWRGHNFRWSSSSLTVYCPIAGMRSSNQWLDTLSFNPEGADLTGAYWRDAKVTFLEGTLTKEQLYATTNYKRKTLRNTVLRGLKDDDWDFSGQDLTGVQFRDRWSNVKVLSLPRADFTDAIVTRTIVELTPEQFKSTWNYKKGIFRDVYMGNNRAELEKLRTERMALEPAEPAPPE